ncbi:MAG TPA: phage tail protein [Rhizomicrobium sp.]
MSLLRTNPVLNHNFVVSLLDTSSVASTIASAALSAGLDVAVGGFSECQGIEASMVAEEYKEGGNNAAVLKFASRVAWTNITLKRGMLGNTSLWDWFDGYVQGRGKRRDGLIVLLNELKLPNTIWFFRRGLPVKYSGPQMRATENNVAIESIEIAHEGVYQVPGVGLVSGLGSALAGGGAGNLANAALSGIGG